MFDLEQSIAEWRRQMLAAGIKTPVPLEELESHLCEDIEQQMRSGIAARSAFELAVQRVGHAGPLKHEFEKAGVSGQRLSSKYLGIYCYVTAPIMLLVSLAAMALSETHPVDLVGVVLLVLYTGCLPRWHSLLANPRSRLVQAALLIGGFFLLTWPLWAMLHLLPSGSPGDMIGASILPAWFAMFLSCMVYGRVNTAEQIESTSGTQKKQNV